MGVFTFQATVHTKQKQGAGVWFNKGEHNPSPFFMKFISTAVMVALVAIPGLAFAANDSTSQSVIDTLTAKIAELSATVQALSQKVSALSSKTITAAVANASVSPGGRAQISSNVASTYVYARPTQPSTTRGLQYANAMGDVITEYTETITTTSPSGCVQAAAVLCTIKTTYKYWKKVDFDSGPSGWVLASTLSPATSLKYVTNSPTFTLNTSNVRSTPNGTILATQPTTAMGSVTGGAVSSGGYVWWPVNFVSGSDGWVAESNLKNPDIELPLPEPKFLSVPRTVLADPTQLAQLSTYVKAPVPSITDERDIDLSSLLPPFAIVDFVQHLSNDQIYVKYQKWNEAKGVMDTVSVIMGKSQTNPNAVSIAAKSALEGSTNMTISQVQTDKDSSSIAFQMKGVTDTNDTTALVVLTWTPEGQVFVSAASKDASGSAEFWQSYVPWDNFLQGIDAYTWPTLPSDAKDYDFSDADLSYGAVKEDTNTDSVTINTGVGEVTNLNIIDGPWVCRSICELPNQSESAGMNGFFRSLEMIIRLPV